MFIIGGASTYDTVAQYKDDQWTLLDDLNNGRSWHASITVEGQTMIVGGVTYVGSR